MRKFSVSRQLEDEHLADAETLGTTFQATITELSQINPDWRTLDLRLFRDVHADVDGNLWRDDYLTLRASVLAKDVER